MNKKIKNNKKGFTIVELVVIIVVIGILASIIYLGYGAWRKNVTISELKSDLIQAASAMENYRNFHDEYPTSVTQVFTPSNGVSIGGGDYFGENKYQLTVLKDKMFYYLTNSDKTPKEGLGSGIVTPGLVAYFDAESDRSNPGTTEGTTWKNLINNADGVFKYARVANSCPSILNKNDGGVMSFYLPGNCDSYLEIADNPIDQPVAKKQAWSVIALVNLDTAHVGSDNIYYQSLASIDDGINLVWGRAKFSDSLGYGVGDYIDPADVNVPDGLSYRFAKPAMFLRKTYGTEGIYYQNYAGIKGKIKNVAGDKYTKQDDIAYTLLDNKWHLMSYVFQHSNSTNKIYDGDSLVSGFSGPMTNNAANSTNPHMYPVSMPSSLSIGSKLRGKLSKVLIYDRAFFSQEEISQNYCAMYKVYEIDPSNIPDNISVNYPDKCD